jgi:hypothetical protein
MSATPGPTAGQRRMLQLAARVNRRLVGQRATGGAGGGVRYMLVELPAYAPERVVVADVAPALVASLEAAEWVVRGREEPEGKGGRWVSGVTPAGIVAANS